MSIPWPVWAAAMTDKRARAIIKRISESAIKLAIIQRNLCDDEGQELNQATIVEITEDIYEVLCGDETGCLLPEEMTKDNCELKWLQCLDKEGTALAADDVD